MKCIIVDDEKLARQLLQSYVEQIPNLELAASCKDGIEANAAILEQDIDLVISDIQMPGLLGTELIKSLSNPPMVIFTTAYKDYAVEGFELEAIDYLIKPFPIDRFLKAINKAFERFELQNGDRTLEAKQGYLTIKADHKLYKVQYTDIRYIEGMREYVSFHVPTGRITALMSLKNLETILPKETFIRCHKSFIINKTLVETLEGSSLTIQGKSIPIGQSYKEKVVADVF